MGRKGDKTIENEREGSPERNCPSKPAKVCPVLTTQQEVNPEPSLLLQMAKRSLCPLSHFQKTMTLCKIYLYYYFIIPIILAPSYLLGQLLIFILTTLLTKAASSYHGDFQQKRFLLNQPSICRILISKLLLLVNSNLRALGLLKPHIHCLKKSSFLEMQVQQISQGQVAQGTAARQK